MSERSGFSVTNLLLLGGIEAKGDSCFMYQHGKATALSYTPNTNPSTADMTHI